MPTARPDPLRDRGPTVTVRTPLENDTAPPGSNSLGGADTLVGADNTAAPLGADTVAGPLLQVQAVTSFLTPATIAGASGTTLILDWDSSVATAPTGFMTAAEDAASFLANSFANPITITIQMGWGEVGGSKIGSNAVGESDGSDIVTTYAVVRNALVANATSTDQITADATLPIADPTGGDTFDVSFAEAKALGLTAGQGISARSTEVDGQVGLNSSLSYSFNPDSRAASGDYDAIGALEHEMTEVMGRIGSVGYALGSKVYTPLDMFRYSSPGVRDLKAASAYFSVDGQTMLLPYNNPTSGGDAADWASSVSGDSFGDSAKDTVEPVSATDLRELNVIGYQLAGATTTPAAAAPALTAVAMSPATGIVGVGWVIAITLTFSAAVTVTGSPTLALNDGGTASYASGSGGTALVFTTTIVAGDSNVAALQVASVTIPSGAAISGAGGGAALSLAALSQDGPQVALAAAQTVPITIAGTVAGQTSGETASQPFASVIVSDSNTVADTVTVTLSAPGNGTLSDIAGSYDAATGVYTASGPASAVTAALQSLTFTPNPAATQPGQSTTTVFAIAVSDVDGAAASDGTTSLTVTEGANPLPNVAAQLSTAAETALAAALAGLTPAGTIANVVNVEGGGTIAAAVGRVLNVLDETSAPAGATITLPAGYAAGYLTGGAAALADTAGGAVLVDTAANGMLSGTGNDTLIGANVAATLLAGAGPETVVSGTAASAIVLSGGASNVLSQGSDQIFGGSGQATITSLGNAVFFGQGGGVDYVAAGGSPTLIGFGGGAETVTAIASAPLVFGPRGAMLFVAGSGAGTIVGGAGASDQIIGGTGRLLYFGNGPTGYTPGTATDTILGGTGSLTAMGGANGALIFGGTAGGNVLSSGSGAATLYGGGAGDVLTATAVQGAASVAMAASGGAETLNAAGSTGTVAMYGGNGSDSMVGGSGVNFLTAGPGNMTLVGGGAVDDFIFLDGARSNTVIQDFSSSRDHVILTGGFSTASVINALSGATATSAGAVMTLSDGTRITFAGLAVGSLNVNHVVL
jgi:Ca2+-binding RTX toxin-like protein